jgi:hypothetical protein
VTALRAAHPGGATEARARAARRAGRPPLLRRVWAPPGQRPVATARPRHEWAYGYACVRPATGETSWRLPPTVSAAAAARALRQSARAGGAGGTRRLALGLDGAGGRGGTAVAVPDGLPRVTRPPYPPARRPAARLGARSDAPLVNRHCADLDARDAAQADRCRALRAQPDVIRAHTRFHWWPDTG